MFKYIHYSNTEVLIRQRQDLKVITIIILKKSYLQNLQYIKIQLKRIIIFFLPAIHFYQLFFKININI